MAERVNTNGTTALYFLFTDHLGSTSVVVDSSGAVVSRQLYRAFGTPRYSSGTDLTDYGYTGQRADDSIGLMYYNARWYDPALGRFTQADTIIAGAGNPIAWDRYAYVTNNPILMVDPTGHRLEEGDTCSTARDCQAKWRSENNNFIFVVSNLPTIFSTAESIGNSGLVEAVLTGNNFIISGIGESVASLSLRGSIGLNPHTNWISPSNIGNAFWGSSGEGFTNNLQSSIINKWTLVSAIIILGNNYYQYSQGNLSEYELAAANEFDLFNLIVSTGAGSIMGVGAGGLAFIGCNIGCAGTIYSLTSAATSVYVSYQINTQRDVYIEYRAYYIEQSVAISPVINNTVIGNCTVGELTAQTCR